MAVAPETYARITNLSIRDEFHSSTDDYFSAIVEIENKSDYPHATQLVFRGYVRDEKQLFYEFLHEQAWILVQPNVTIEKEIRIDVWLPRFPPTMNIADNLKVEYAVRATVDPWFQNSHVEKLFDVRRSLILKEPHESSYPIQVYVNECVGHGLWSHKKCNPINGELWIDKGAFCPAENISVKWKLIHEGKIESVTACLIQKIEYRVPDAGHPMLIKEKLSTVAEKKVSTESPVGTCDLAVPNEIPVTIAMTLWNVLSINYYLAVLVKTSVSGKKDAAVEIKIPLIIADQAVKGHQGKTKKTKDLLENKVSNNFRRAIDVNDDSEDDDDYDSDIEETTTQYNRDMHYSIDIDRIEIKTSEKNGTLRDAYAQLHFTVNSTTARPLRNLRLLLQGEVRAHSHWYEFLRFKAIVSTDGATAFSPGPHSVKIALPFRDSQYDTNILAPSLGEDIRYVCSASMVPWKNNVVPAEKELHVDRFVDTWAKEEYKGEHREKLGAYGIYMRQRVFQRGKHVFAKITGHPRKIRLELIQQRRLRIPGLTKDESYCYVRRVAVQDYSEDRRLWPEEHSVHIPPNVPPSIEITYWNVVVLNYSLVVVLTLDDGHEHTHEIPIWIGCNNDRLAPPQPAKYQDPGMVRVASPGLGELPEFEVIKPEETHIHPYWVERVNDHTYGYQV